jgi:hypothetical protein
MQQKARRDTTPDLLLKYQNTTVETYVSRQMKHLKHTSETLEKTLENNYNHTQHLDKTHAMYV